MTVAAAAHPWVAWLRAAAALSFVTTAAAGTGVADQPNVEIIEPSSMHKTEGLCQYSYDALALEPLRFNLTVTCGSLGCYSVLVRRNSSLVPVNGCRHWCGGGHFSCSLGCTASKALDRYADEGAYQIEAEANLSFIVVPKTTINICVHVQGSAYVRFIGNQTTSVTSDNGSVVLSYLADGYPRPVSYELACSSLRVKSLNLTGSSGSLPPGTQDRHLWRSGNLTLTNLPVGVALCTVIAYTDRRLAVTQPLAVVIHVVSDKPPSSSSNGNDAYSSAPASILSTRSLMVQSLTSAQQDLVQDAKEKELIIATVIPCVVLSLISISLVGYAAFKRRTEQPTAICPGAGGRNVQRNAAHVAPIINNNTTTYNYYGDHIEIIGPGSTIVMQGSGQSNSRFAVHLMDTDDG